PRGPRSRTRRECPGRRGSSRSAQNMLANVNRRGVSRNRRALLTRRGRSATRPRVDAGRDSARGSRACRAGRLRRAHRRRAAALRRCLEPPLRAPPAGRRRRAAHRGRDAARRRPLPARVGRDRRAGADEGPALRRRGPLPRRARLRGPAHPSRCVGHRFPPPPGRPRRHDALGRGQRAPVLVHRDFMAWNLHVQDGRLRLLDFQDALLGPDAYDLAALLTDRTTGTLVAPDLERELIAHFRAARAAAALPVDGDLATRYRLCALHRALKVIGRFYYLERVLGKAGYLADLPGVYAVARRMLAGLPALESVRARLAAHV